MLVLASASPRRQELLRQLGLAFEVQAANVPEARQTDESPVSYVCRVAADKARRVARRRADSGMAPLPVLGADTEVTIDDEILGKPRDRTHAAAMLRRLSGRRHTVVTAICLVTATDEHQALSASRVEFAELAEADIHGYLATGEADDKAGSYAIQGRAAGFIKRLEGSYSGVMGLPLYELHELLQRAGVAPR